MYQYNRLIGVIGRMEPPIGRIGMTGLIGLIGCKILTHLPRASLWNPGLQGMLNLDPPRIGPIGMLIEAT